MSQIYYAYELHRHGTKMPPESVGGSGMVLGFCISHMYPMVVVQCWKKGTVSQQAQNEPGKLDRSRMHSGSARL